MMYCLKSLMWLVSLLKQDTEDKACFFFNYKSYIEKWVSIKWRGKSCVIHIEINIERDKLTKIVASVQFSSVQSLSCVRLFATPWIAARQASLSIANSQSSLRLTSIKSVMPYSPLILCHPLLLPPIPPSIRVFSNESTLCMRWPIVLDKRYCS